MAGYRVIRDMLPIVAMTLLTGCAIQPAPTTVQQARPGITGNVHGGQQPVAGSTIQLYTVGITAYGASSTPLLTQTVTSDANGSFNITSLYSCTSATLVYLTATGGNPGAVSNNPNLALMTALGPCSSLISSTFISVNELTTVAAVSALNPFMTGLSAIGAPPSAATDLAAAFTLSSQLVDPSTGTSPGNNVPAGDTVPTTLINTLADVLATCVNSSGGVAGDSSTCGQLFTLTVVPPSTAYPTNTVAALLNLATHPTLNTPALYNLLSPIAPFQPQLSLAPPDFQVRLVPPASSVPLQISPATLTFPSVAVSSTSPAQTVIILNNGSTAVQLSFSVSAFSIIGTNAADFSETDSCPPVLNPGLSCAVQVSTTPTVSGPRTAYLSIVSNTSASPQYVSLSETATPQYSGPHAALSNYFVQFNLGGVTQDLTVTNTGAADLTLGAISTATPYFVATSNCGSSLVTNASCTISVLNRAPAYSLNGVNYFYDRLSIPTNDTSFPQSIIVAANNGSLISPSNIDFSGVVVGQVATTSLTLLGTGVYNFFSTDPAFPNPTGCAAFHASPCILPFQFHPTSTGPHAARLNITGGDNIAYYIPVLGTGVSSISTSATLSPAGLTFQDLSPLSISAAQTVTFSNSSSTAVNIQSIAATSGFAQTNTCGSVLAPNSSCTISVTSNQPTIAFSMQGALTVTDDAGSQSIPLTATIDPILPFGTWAIGQTAFLQPSIPSIYVGGLGVVTGDSDFDGTHCSAPPVGLTCSPPDSFVPLTTGIRSATYTTISGSLSSSFLLLGTGVTAGPALTFGAQPSVTSKLGGSANLSITAYNSGSTALNFNSCALTGANASQFAFSSFTCAGAHAVGSSFPVTLTFSPTQFGLQSASLVFTDAGSGQSFALPITGLGTPPVPTISGASSTFPATHLGQSGAPMSFTVTAMDHHPVTASLASLGVNPKFFLTKASCAQDEVPCIVTLVFRPDVSGPISDYLFLTDVYGSYSSTTNPGIPLAGIGGIPLASVSSTSLTFALAPVFTTSAAQTITLSNTGDGSLAITSIVLSGANASEFSTTNNCSTSVAPNNASCSISVRFIPATAGPKSASVEIFGDPNGGLPITIPITASAQ